VGGKTRQRASFFRPFFNIRASRKSELRSVPSISIRRCACSTVMPVSAATERAHCSLVACYPLTDLHAWRRSLFAGTAIPIELFPVNGAFSGARTGEYRRRSPRMHAAPKWPRYRFEAKGTNCWCFTKFAGIAIMGYADKQLSPPVCRLGPAADNPPQPQRPPDRFPCLIPLGFFMRSAWRARTAASNSTSSTVPRPKRSNTVTAKISTSNDARSRLASAHS